MSNEEALQHWRRVSQERQRILLDGFITDLCVIGLVTAVVYLLLSLW